MGGSSGFSAFSGSVEIDVDGSAGPDERLRLSDVGKLVRRQQRRLVRTARADEQPTCRRLLADHLACPPETVDVVEESWPGYELVNVQLGLDAWLAEGGREHRLVGLTRTRHNEVTLSDLLLGEDDFGHGPRPGVPSWSTQASGPDGATRQALRAGIYLVGDGEVRLVLMLLAPDPEFGRSSVQLHVAADRPDVARAAATEIRRLALVHNVFRGHVLSFGEDVFEDRRAAMRFHTRPEVGADDVILPAEALEVIRRQVVGVARHRERLLAAGQHLKRGILLHGPPGVGKTHTVRHLMSELSGVTIVLLSGDALGMIAQACSVARTLQPSMIVIEDVDLIAEDRDRYGGRTPLLFELLNQMDGLAEDADVVFLLTTNRADALESALAARPGRVDQAIALELPDAESRTRLVELYRGSLDLDTSRLDEVIARTEGVTASFLKELLRRAALAAADDESTGPGRSAEALHVGADHLVGALEELLDTRNAMTRALLGAGGTESGSPAR